MHSKKPTHRQAKRLGAMAVAASMLLETVTPAFAGVSQLPGLYITPPDASVMFTLDDSGSMQSDSIPDFSKPGVDYTGVPNDNSSKFAGTLALPRMWMAGSAYLSATYYKKTNAIARYMRSSAGNPLYYDPAVLYQPWPVAAPTQNPGRMTPADPTKVNVDTDNPGATGYQLDLTKQVDSGPTTAVGEDRYFWPATYYIYKPTAPAMADASPNDPNNTFANFTKIEIQGSGTATFANSSTYRTDCAAGVCTRAAEMQNFANWLQYYRNRRLMAKGGTAAAFAAQGTNLRTGFTMISKNSVLRKMRPFTGADRTDFFNKIYTTASGNGGTPLRSAMDVVGQYFRTADQDSPWATTPGTSVGTESECRRAFHVMSTDGFWNGAEAGTAAAKTDADNFLAGVTPAKPDGTTYLFSDSLASDADPLKGRFTVTPFADGNADTLADVAAYYWKTDLRSTLPNRVPPSTRDPAFWQHLQTFTIGLGVSGSGEVARHSDGSKTVTQPPAPALAVPLLVNYLGHPWLADQAVRDYLIKNKVALDWTKPLGDDAATGDDLIHASMNGRGKYFSAKNPTQLAGGLAAALAEATDNPGSLANVVTQSPQVVAGSAVYQATYNPSQWSGRLYAFGQSADGSVITTPGTEIWEASNKMPTPLPPSPPGRNIFTWNPDSAVGSTFTWGTGGLTATQKANLNSDSTLLDFLRGSDTNEIANGGTFRDRARYAKGSVPGGVLGDIVNGSPIKGPTAGAGYDRLPTGAAGRDTYATFRSSTGTALDNMRNTIYLGANDGMLHAFSNSDGVERFAYVPNSVFSVPVSSTVTELKLKMLSDPGYLHRFTVDGPPQIGDAFIQTPGMTSADWRSVLVGSTGAGARSVFAMDVTNPASGGVGGFSPSNVLWEYSDTNNIDMGYVISYPHVARMRDGSWVAIFGNGYDSKNGQAKLFVLNLQTGAVVWQRSVGPAGGNGLSQPNFTLNANREVTAIYAGDLQGNLWKFDVDNPDATKWKVAFGSAPDYKPLFTGSATQPITVMPEITFHPNGGTLVSFGTGELFKTEDTAAAVAAPGPQVNVNLNTQAIYGIWDKPGESNGFVGNSTLVLQGATAAVAANVSAKLTGTTTNTVDWATKRGWYMNLGTSNGERVNVNSQQVNSVLLVVSNNPDNDPCSSGGSARLFILDPITGGAPNFAVFDANGVGGITTADKGFNVKSFSFGVLSLPTLQSKRSGSDTVITESVSSRGQTGARLGGVENKPATSSDCAKWLLAGGSDTSISGVDMATCGTGNARVSWRQLK